MKEDAKVCPFCAEPISREAMICPRCRQWQTSRSFRNPAIFISLICAAGIASLAILTLSFKNYIDRLSRALSKPRANYTDFLDSVQVQESKMDWTEGGTHPGISVAGVLTNKSTVAWSNPEVECRFYDAKGSLVDVVNEKPFITIRALDTAAFRISFEPMAASNNYSSFRARVNMCQPVRW